MARQLPTTLHRSEMIGNKDGFTTEFMAVTDQGEAEATIMALAHLAVERPGWQIYLANIADKCGAGGLEMFKRFHELHQDVTKMNNEDLLIDKLWRARLT